MELTSVKGCTEIVAVFLIGHLTGELCWYARGYFAGYRKAVDNIVSTSPDE